MEKRLPQNFPNEIKEWTLEYYKKQSQKLISQEYDDKQPLLDRLFFDERMDRVWVSLSKTISTDQIKGFVLIAANAITDVSPLNKSISSGVAKRMNNISDCANQLIDLLNPFLPELNSSPNKTEVKDLAYCPEIFYRIMALDDLFDGKFDDIDNFSQLILLHEKSKQIAAKIKDGAYLDMQHSSRKWKGEKAHQTLFSKKLASFTTHALKQPMYSILAEIISIVFNADDVSEDTIRKLLK